MLFPRCSRLAANRRAFPSLAVLIIVGACFGSVLAIDPRTLGDTAAQSADQSTQVDTLPRTLTNSGTRHKLILRAGDDRIYQRLMRDGAVLHDIDYGSYRVVVVDERRVGGRLALATLGTPVRDDQNLIGFSDAVLDTTRPRAGARRLPPALRHVDAADAAQRDRRTPVLDLELPEDESEPLEPGLAPRGSLFVVQFVGPVRDEWLEALSAAGVTVISYVPANAYVVRARGEAVQRLRTLRRTSPFIQFIGRYEPGYRLSPGLRRLREQRAAVADPPIDLTVQITDGPEAAGTLAALRSLSTIAVLARRVLNYYNVSMRVARSRLTQLAQMDGVFAVDERRPRRRLDEAQGQILANQLAANGQLTGPGYLTWLTGKGFTANQFDSFVVNVVDDATSLQGHPDMASSRVAFETNPTNQSGDQTGHGFFNAHILGGMNNATGSAFQDASGYRYGLGIAPFVRVGATAVFGPTGAAASEYEAEAYGLGARISNNSWGYDTTRYDVDAQEADAIVRDAQGSVPGLQPMVMVFAAGNDGTSVGAGSVMSPATAKNVIAVGATENERPTGTDGCGRGNALADNASDLAPFSSRGPVNASGGDDRFKPDLVAPGVHVQAAVPQSNYRGSELCNQYWPAGQTLYSWSSGTSHSTPAVSGAAALVYQYFLNRGWGAPSPAMVKAYLMSAATYLTGGGGNDTLPSNNQGMGRVNLDLALKGGTRLVVDQSVTLGASGEIYERTGWVASGTEPVRITLAWTDAPGPTVGAPWVNDLDLEVTFNGSTYLGNVFSGAASVAGGTADNKNNVESVFLPAGVSGTMTIRVIATNIAGDGIPHSGDATDQDFALVAHNVGQTAPVTGVTLTSDKPSPQFAGTPVTVTADARGGTAPLSYKWWIDTGVSWVQLQNWSTSASYVWTALEAGVFQIAVWVRGADSIADSPEATGALAFTVLPLPPLPSPTVSGLSPNRGPTEGGTTVTITGTDFLPGATVTVGGVPATNVAVVSDTTITAVTGAHSAGVVDVAAMNPGAAEGTLADAFTYAESTTPHPGDLDGDFRLVISEVTGYGAAWKRGDAWPTAPVPIPIGHVTRAGYLWRNGETYRQDAGDCPACWVPTVLNPAGLSSHARAVLAAPAADRVSGKAAIDVVATWPSQGLSPEAVATLTIVANKPSPQPAETPVACTALPSGATTPLAYQWWIFDGQIWRRPQE